MDFFILRIDPDTGEGTGICTHSCYGIYRCTVLIHLQPHKLQIVCYHLMKSYCTTALTSDGNS